MYLFVCSNNRPLHAGILSARLDGERYNLDEAVVHEKFSKLRT